MTEEESSRDTLSAPSYNYRCKDCGKVLPNTKQLRGSEEFIDTVKNIRSAFADLHYEEQEIFASDDKVVQILNVTWKHIGNFFVIHPTGNNISYKAVHIYRIGEDGKVVEHRQSPMTLHS